LSDSLSATSATECSSADGAIIHEGQTDAPLFTLLSGWAFRLKTLSDGRRQILNFLLQGDFIVVQPPMRDAAAHGVQALAEVALCVFRRDALWEFHRSAPTLGFSVRLTAHDESLVDDTLLLAGRRSTEERIATLLIVPHKRVAALLLEGSAPRDVPFPLTRQHSADDPGLALVHTNKSLRKLEGRGLHRIENGRLRLLDMKALARLATAIPWRGQWSDRRATPARPGCRFCPTRLSARSDAAAPWRSLRSCEWSSASEEPGAAKPNRWEYPCAAIIPGMQCSTLAAATRAGSGAAAPMTSITRKRPNTRVRSERYTGPMPSANAKPSTRFGSCRNAADFTAHAMRSHHASMRCLPSFHAGRARDGRVPCR
jgi:CRP-like cAMP-binding protein